MVFKLTVFEVRGIKASKEQIYVKIKWKNASGYQEEHKSPEVSASNAVFAPPFCLDIESIDSAAKVSFAVKESATLIAKTLGSSEQSLSQMLDSQSETFSLNVGSLTITCSLQAPEGARERRTTASTGSSAGSAVAHSSKSAGVLFETDDNTGSSAKTGILDKALDGVSGILNKVKGGEPNAADASTDPADIDDDEDGTSTERFELKVPDNPSTIKKGPYRVYVHLHEARDMRSSSDPALRNKFPDPVFTVQTCAKKEYTKRKKKCQACLINQLFVFDFEQKDVYDMDLEKVNIQFVNSKKFSDELVGVFELDMSVIYHQTNHELANCWVGMSDPKGESSEIMAFLKLSVCVVGEGDELPVHDDDEDDEGENAMEMTKCLMPPSLEQEKRCWQISVIKAINMPHTEGLRIGALSNIRRMNFFAMASFGGLKCRTATFKDKRDELNPGWFELLTLPFNMPTFSEMLQLSFSNYHKPKHDLVSTINFRLKDVNANPGRYGPYAPPVWYHLYGSPILPALDTPKVMAITDSLNKGIRDGVEYKGSVLISLHHRLSEDVQRESSGRKNAPKHLLSTKGIHKLSSNARSAWQTNGTMETLRLRLTVHEGHELLGSSSREGRVFVSVAFGKAGATREKRYESLADNIYRTDPVEVTKGVHQFYQSGAAIPDIDLQHYLTRPSEDPLDNAPDIFCYVYYEKSLMPTTRLGYVRLSAKDCRGTSNTPKWHKVIRDPYTDNTSFTGYLLLDVSVDTKQSFDDKGLTVSRKRNLEPPVMRHYMLVAQVYIARGLPAADSNGLSDPFVEVHLGGVFDNTETIYNTLNPSWYSTIKCEVEVPEEKSLRRQITCMVRDANQGAEKLLEKAGSLVGIKAHNTLLGRCDISLDGISSKFQSPKWYELYDPSTGTKSEGRILLGFQLISREDYDESKIKKDIRPAYEPNCTLHICALGCRSLASYGFRPINNSLVEMDCVDAEAKTHTVMSRNSNNPTGSDPNFCQILKMKLALPRDANFAPVLTIRSVDHRLFGASKPTVGACSISLDEHVFSLFNERDTTVGVDPMFSAPAQDEEAALAAKLDKMTPEEIDDMYKKMQEKKRQSAAAVLQSVEEDGGEEMQRDPSSAGPGDYEPAVVTGPELAVAGEDIILSDDEGAADDKPYYMTVNGKQREELKTSVEAKTGAPPFESLVLMRGRAKGRGFFSRLLRIDAPANVGSFKASIAITKSKDTSSPAAMAQALSRITNQSDLTPRMLVVRVYVLKGYRLFNGDSSGGSEMHTFVKVSLGANVISRREFSKKGNDNIEYYEVFELAAMLPGIALLNISVCEKNVFGFDNLLGTGIIDLENRWYSKTWRALQPKPIEQIALRLPTSRLPQGKLSLWVDILTNAESASSPFFDISLPPPIKFEIRLVLWRAKDMVCRDEVRRQSDLFLVADLTSLELALQTMRDETDTHWFATDGIGSFNWRIKFNVTLPMKKARLTLQAWDNNLISNDAIGERVIPMTAFLKRAYMAQVNKLKAAKAPAASAGSKPPKRPPIRPLGNGGDNVARFPKKGKNFKGDGNPTYWAELFNGTKDSSGKFLPQGQIEMELACLTQDDADIRPVGSGREDPNRDPEMPRPDRVKWSLFHPMDILADIMGPHLFNKFKRYMCLILCLSATVSILYFIGPLIGGNVLGAIAGKGLNPPSPPPPPSS